MICCVVRHREAEREVRCCTQNVAGFSASVCVDTVLQRLIQRNRTPISTATLQRNRVQKPLVACALCRTSCCCGGAHYQVLFFRCWPLQQTRKTQRTQKSDFSQLVVVELQQFPHPALGRYALDAQSAGQRRRHAFAPLLTRALTLSRKQCSSAGRRPRKNEQPINLKRQSETGSPPGNPRTPHHKPAPGTVQRELPSFPLSKGNGRSPWPSQTRVFCCKHSCKSMGCTDETSAPSVVKFATLWA